MVSSYIASYVEEVGLGKVLPYIASYSDEAFLSLMMSDYSKIGVQDIEEKQKLFRVIKHLSANRLAEQQVQRPTPKVVQQDKHNGLLDLEEQDGDLLSDDGHAYNISPMGQAHQRPRSAQPPQYAAPIPLAFPTPVTNSDEDPPKIRVVVRKRPISRKERERGDEDIVDVSIGGAFVIVNETKVKVDLTKYLEKHQFNFDDAIDDTVGNDAVYRSTVQPLVGTLFRNGKASCFAYGQTGSGKTYTMSPLPTRAAADIFQYLARPDYRDIALHVSCFEIYGNKVFDLLNQRKKLNILEDAKKKVVVVGLKEFVVDTVDSVKQLIEESSTRRSTGSTAANADSSRSHSIMQFALKRMPSASAAAAAARFGGDPLEAKLVGKISFIDLAGSERGADTSDNNRQTRLEGAEINKSLLALKECIRALDSDARHVPFRGSKLTAVLRDSFVGDQARTVMIANISPCSTSVEHTLNTLRYADRVKELRKDKADRAPGGVTPGGEQYNAAVLRAGVVPSAGPPGLQPPQFGGLNVGNGGGIGGGGNNFDPYSRQDVSRQSHQAAAAAAAAAIAAAPPPQRQPSYPMEVPPPLRYEHSGSRLPTTSNNSNLSANNNAYANDPNLGGGQGRISNQGVLGWGGGGGGGGGGGDVDMSNAHEIDDSDLAIRHDELMDSILIEEESLVSFHRSKLEEDMELMRREMALLQEVDQPGSEIDNYVEQMTQLLEVKRRGIDELKMRLEGFKAKLREEETLSRTVFKQRDPLR